MLRSYEEELKKSREGEREKNKYQEGKYLPRGTPAGTRKTIEATSTNKPTIARETERVNRESGAPESRERGDESYLTFPGQPHGYPPFGPSPYSYPAEPRYSPQGWGMGGGMPPYYPTYYPPHYGSYFPRRPPDAFGVTAMTFGIVAMCIFWMSAFYDFFGTMLFIVVVCITGMGIIFGGYSFGNRMRRSIHGLVGMILSILAIILSSIVYYIFHVDIQYSIIVSAIF